MAQIRVEANGNTWTVPLAGDATIGRAPEHHLSLPDDSAVSRDHARIVRVATAFFVEDAESRNGTFVMRGGRTLRVTARTPLEHGDTIMCGASRLHFEAPELLAAPSAAQFQTDPGATEVGLRLPRQR